MNLHASATGAQWQRIGVRHHHGIALPLFSLHSDRSPIGEYPDLKRVINWCSEVGFDTLQLLPLNDTGAQSSPYSARSAFALNPLYLQLDALPYVDQDPEFKRMARLPAQEGMRLLYPPIREHKRHFLDAYCARFGALIRKTDGYLQFVQENPWLDLYGLYKVLKRLHGGVHFEDWPEEHLQPSRALMEAHRAELDCHALTQYLCHLQLIDVKKHADQQGVLLMGDLPILIDRDSADVWCHPEYFKLGACAGAPPDPLGPEGQNWGFPPYDWDYLEQTDYQWWRERLSCASRYYHLIRIDHIVGFFRIWTIPRGLSSTEGQFDPPDPTVWEERGRKLLRLLIESSQLLPLGEDLGTIPRVTPSVMKELGICGTRVMRWERFWHARVPSFIPFDQYEPVSLTTVSTHDSTTLAEWYQTDPLAAELAPTCFDLLRASHHTSSLFHVNLLYEYLSCLESQTLDSLPLTNNPLTWGDPRAERINVPGTVSDHNWSIRIRPTLEEWTSHAGLRHYIRALLA